MVTFASLSAEQKDAIVDIKKNLSAFGPEAMAQLNEVLLPDRVRSKKLKDLAVKLSKSDDTPEMAKVYIKQLNKAKVLAIKEDILFAEEAPSSQSRSPKKIPKATPSPAGKAAPHSKVSPLMQSIIAKIAAAAK